MKPDIKPVGVGDLMVVKQQLTRYAAGEVAHIENVMATESRGRRHRRLRRLEESVTFEQERTEENQRDLQSTERFELQQETQKTIQSDTKFQVGAEISAGFGPVQIGVSTEFSTSNSKTESDRNSTTYAKEVTDRSLNKLVERVRQERITRTVDEVEEKNFHKFDNTDGDNRTGVYRWVDKFYRVKVVNYGRRLFYEFVVPEPAAFYVFARTAHINTNVLPEEPALPAHPVTEQPLEPEHVDRTTYLALGKQYDAGITPPPREQVIVSRVIGQQLQSDQNWAFVDSELEIPAGYVGTSSSLYFTSSKDSDDYWFAIHRGRHVIVRRGIGDDDSFGSGVPDIQGIYPVGAHGRGLRSLMISVTVWCTLTEEGFAEWQLKTYQSIMNAYRKKLMTFEEQMAAAQIQEGVEIGGNNPVINRAIEREELKKGCITLWTGYRYTMPPSVIDYTYPEIDRSNAAEIRPEIKFLEQSFDWRNMTYEFYPYYWADKDKWLDMHGRADNDPLFAEFLRAGAARVLVPVHPALTEAVLFYQLTGKLWSGGEVPMFTPPDPTGDLLAPGVVDQTDEELALYRDYVAELADETVPDDIDREIEISPDDPDAWLVKVPTTLVWLQPDAALPDFESPEDDDG